jgi:hypothetical protein
MQDPCSGTQLNVTLQQSLAKACHYRGGNARKFWMPGARLQPAPFRGQTLRAQAGHARAL